MKMQRILLAVLGLALSSSAMALSIGSSSCVGLDAQGNEVSILVAPSAIMAYDEGSTHYVMCDYKVSSVGHPVS